MIKRIALWAFSFLEKRVVISEDRRDVYIYGTELFIHTLISTCVLFLCACVFGKPLDGLIIIGLYYINQTTSGGFHAGSYMQCFIVMIVFMLSALVCLTFLFVPIWVVGLVMIFSLLVLFLCPLMLHPNKYYLKSKASYFIRRSRIITFIEMVVAVTLFVFPNYQMQYAFCLGLMLSAISRISAFAKGYVSH